MLFFCKHCNKNVLPVLKKQFCTNYTLHIRADCPVCNGFLKFVAQDPSLDLDKLEIYDENKQGDLF